MVMDQGKGADLLHTKLGSNRFDAVSSILLFLLVIALSVQGPTLFAIGTMDFTVGHALVGIVGVSSLAWCLCSREGLQFPPAPITALLGLFAVVTCMDVPRFGFGATIFKYVFQYLVLAVSMNLMRLMEPRRAELCIRVSAWIVLAMVLGNACIHVGAFAEYYASPWDGHPNYETVFSGGVNLEATWPAMLGVFMANNRCGWAYLLSAIVFAAGVQSRAGLMLAVGAFVYVVLIKDGVRPSWKRVVSTVFVVLVTAVFTIAGPRALVMTTGMQPSTGDSADVAGGETGSAVSADLQGGAGTGDIEGSSADGDQDSGLPSGLSQGDLIGTPGRKGIWAASLQVFQDAPFFGHGAGNAMDAVRDLSGYPYREDNVHNYPLQVLLDFGLVGFAAFAAVVIGFVVSSARCRFISPFSAFIMLYLVGGMVQFAGGELLAGFAIAGYAAFGSGFESTKSVMRGQIDD